MALSFLFCKSRFNVGRDLCAGVLDEAAYAPERDYPSVHGVLAELARIDLAEGEGHWDIEAGSPKRDENVRSSIESGNAAPPEGPAGRTRTSNLATCRRGCPWLSSSLNAEIWRPISKVLRGSHLHGWCVSDDMQVGNRVCEQARRID